MSDRKVLDRICTTGTDRLFEPYRIPQSALSSALVQSVWSRVQDAIHPTTSARQRAPQKRHDETLFASVQALVCDLAHRYLENPDRCLAVTRSKANLGPANRYRSPAGTKSLRRATDLLKDLGFLEMLPGGHDVSLIEVDPVTGEIERKVRGCQTVIWAGPSLIVLLGQWNLSFRDFAIDHRKEVIVLRGPKPKRTKKSGSLIDYQETIHTKALRKKMHEINSYLEEAPISVLQPRNDHLIDATDRRLRRIFNNGDFGQGGRLYGGFWMPMSKEDRRRCILLAGEDTVELDFGQMVVRLLYGREGINPEGDLYAIPVYENYRDGMKKLLNAMIYSGTPLYWFPDSVAELLPPGLKPSTAIAAIKKHHRPIAHHFGTGVGLQTMKDESDILIDVLSRLRSLSVVALPIHDAIIVPRSKVHIAEAVMKDSFFSYTGIPAVVSVE